MANPRPYDPDSPLTFIVNAGSGRHREQEQRTLIEGALRTAGRAGDLRFVPGKSLAAEAAAAAERAAQRGGALVAVGGDGTINTVAQAAHAAACAFGVVAQGTFNYFARTHGLPEEPDAALQQLLALRAPVPVQAGLVNEQLFLVNASLGLYPRLLQDRELYKNRFGRSRLVALGAALATLFGRSRHLRLELEQDGTRRTVHTPTLFIANNRLQLEQVGVPNAEALENGHLAAVLPRPIGSGALLWLLLRGAAGRLGGAREVDTFVFQRLVVRPVLRGTRRHVKVAYDGEVGREETPLVFRVAEQPLWLLKPAPAAGT